MNRRTQQRLAVRADASGLNSSCYERLENRQLLAGEQGLRVDFFQHNSTVFQADSLAVKVGPVYSRIDANISYEWGLGAPASGVRSDNFSARWTGQIRSLDAGQYTFRVAADDGIRLWINGQRIIDRWQVGSGIVTGSIALPAGGSHDIRLDYFERTGNAELKFEWLRPGQFQFSPVSQEFLYPFSKPLVIDKPGMYVGSWENSDNPDLAAIKVVTTAPVSIVSSNLRSVGDLINAADYVDQQKSFQLTVRDTSGLGLQPTRSGRLHGAFLRVSSATALLVENNYMEKVSYGVVVNGYAGPANANYPIVIRNNRGKNVEGRYTMADGSLDNGPQVRENYYFSHFIQLAGGIEEGTYGIPGVDIRWNEVINDPHHSRVEDNISIYQASGTADKPILIHHNFIRGAYHGNPAENRQFTGTAIQVDSNGRDGNQATAATSTAFVDIAHNIAVAATISGAVGHDVAIHDNRVVYSGWTPAGERLWSYVSGISFGDYLGETIDTRFNLSAYNNVVGAWNQNQDWGGASRNDYEFTESPGAMDWSRTYNNQSLTVDPTAPITVAMELAEQQRWNQKLQTAGQIVGPRRFLHQLATDRIQFENYHRQAGVENYGAGIGYLDDRDWVLFRNIVFTGTERAIELTAATPFDDFRVEIRLNSATGPRVGSFLLPATGSWNSMVTTRFNIDAIINDRQTLYFVFQGAANLDAFQCVTESPQARESQSSTKSHSLAWTPLAARALDDLFSSFDENDSLGRHRRLRYQAMTQT
jgi:hypothetical protein